MANANILFNSPTGSIIADGNLIQAADFEKDGTLLYDPTTTTLYLSNVNVGGNATGNIVASTGSTKSAKIPVGTTADRDATPSTGFLRFNTTLPAGLEVYDGTAWQSIPFGGNAVLKTGVNGSAIMPAGTTAQRDAAPAVGYLRYNTTAPAGFEYWDGTVWQQLTNNSTAVLKTGPTGAAIMPAGATGDRPGSPATGYTRYNTTLSAMEVWDGTSWTTVGGSTLVPATPAQIPIGAMVIGEPSLTNVYFQNPIVCGGATTISCYGKPWGFGPIIINYGTWMPLGCIPSDHLLFQRIA